MRHDVIFEDFWDFQNKILWFKKLWSKKNTFIHPENMFNFTYSSFESQYYEFNVMYVPTDRKVTYYSSSNYSDYVIFEYLYCVSKSV